jgi:hypothetical protein
MLSWIEEADAGPHACDKDDRERILVRGRHCTDSLSRASSISDDQTAFWGKNLVFGKIKVGSGTPKAINCTEDLSCFLPGGFAKTYDGFLFFVTDTTPPPFMQVTATGIQAVAAHHPPKTVAPRPVLRAARGASIIRNRQGNDGRIAPFPPCSNTPALTSTSARRGIKHQ